MSYLVKMFMVFTSLSPVILVHWIKTWEPQKNFFKNWEYLAVVFGLTIACYIIIFTAKKKLEIVPVKVLAVKPADNKMISFLLIYILPILKSGNNFSLIPLVVFFLFLTILIASSNSYHFNPLLRLIGYHFYEVTVEGNINYIILSKRKIENIKEKIDIVEISDYMIMEV